MNKKNVKKGLLFVLCMALVSVVSIVGTMAVLSKQTGPIVNTFQPENTLATTFTLTETAADGSSTTNTGREYTGLVPNQVLTKDPKINFSALNAEAYLFVEILEANNEVEKASNDDTVLGKLLNYTVDSDWTKLDDVTGVNGGEVYYQKKAKGAVGTNIAIIADDTVTVYNYVESNVVANASITLNAYLCQTVGFTGADDDAKAAAAYTTVWPYVAP